MLDPQQTQEHPFKRFSSATSIGFLSRAIDDDDDDVAASTVQPARRHHSLDLAGQKKFTKQAGLFLYGAALCVSLSLSDNQWIEGALASVILES